MGVRGRVSSAALAVAPIDIVPRQRPPHELTDEQTEVWAAVVNSQPADWFTPATVPLLSQYCRHVITARHVAEMIERAVADKNFLRDEYDKLLKMQERESRAIATLATKMRVSQQSITNHRGNKKTISGEKAPWEA
jgi:hypothetical protein